MCRCGLPTAATPLWQLAQPLVIPAWLNFVPGLLPVVPALGVAPSSAATPVGAFVPEELAGILVVALGLLVAVPGFACPVGLAAGPVAPIGGALEKLLAKFVVRFCWAAPCAAAGA